MNIKIFNISFYVENQEVKSLVTNFSFIKKKDNSQKSFISPKFSHQKSGCKCISVTL